MPPPPLVKRSWSEVRDPGEVAVGSPPPLVRDLLVPHVRDLSEVESALQVLRRREQGEGVDGRTRGIEPRRRPLLLDPVPLNHLGVVLGEDGIFTSALDARRRISCLD